ncbi:MAG: hypothetical protein DHS20C15_19500 [Planctomycetota bacterium]|nr:MAG: hypothetical protein DHS20C15_19500 [Planctomycetota bacterium]
MTMSTFHVICFSAAMAAPLAAQNTANVSFRDTQTNVATQATSDTRALVWFDYDGDLDLDLFALNYDQVKQLYRNDAGALVLDDTLPAALLGAEKAKGVDIGDVDGDGDLDVVVANAHTDPNRVYLNQGGAQAGTEGAFAAPIDFPAQDTAHAYDVALGDLDGDGQLDAVFVNWFAANQLYFGLGDGTFLLDAASPVGQGADASRQVDLVDLELDGDLDIVVANSNGADNQIFVNQGFAQAGLQGDFVELTLDAFVADGGDSYGIEVGDLNGDGLPEIAVANRFQANALYVNQSTPAGIAFERVIVDGFDPDADASTFRDSYDFVFGDLDNDGDMDIVVANRVMQNCILLAVDDAAELEFESVEHGQVVTDRGDSRAVALNDLDGDGFPELSVANTLGGSNFQYENLGCQWTDVGNALAGTLGEPVLIGRGDVFGGESISLDTLNGPPNTVSIVFIGQTSALTPFRGGVIVPSLEFVLTRMSDAEGKTTVSGNYPNSLPVGFQFFFQTVASDAGAPEGATFSNALRSTGL